MLAVQQSTCFFFSETRHASEMDKGRGFKHRPWSPSRGTSSPLTFKLSRVKPKYANMPAVLVAARADCYAKHTVSFPAVAETIASTHCTYPRRVGQAEWAWVARWQTRQWWSPVPVLTGLDVAQLCWCDLRCFHDAKPARPMNIVEMKWLDFTNKMFQFCRVQHSRDASFRLQVLRSRARRNQGMRPQELRRPSVGNHHRVPGEPGCLFSIVIVHVAGTTGTIFHLAPWNLLIVNAI